jgi:hypothetical protein
MSQTTDYPTEPVSNDPSAVETTDRPSGGGRWRIASRIPAKLRAPWALTILAVLVAPLLVVGGLSTLATTTSDPSTARLISADTLERDYGVRFDLVGVTASGGLIDLRFTVIDPEKAKALFHTATSTPTLYVEGTGAVLHTKKGMSHTLTLLPGARYVMLYPNAGGAVQSGTPVSVVIDDVRIEPIAAQS